MGEVARGLNVCEEILGGWPGFKDKDPEGRVGGGETRGDEAATRSPYIGTTT